MIPFDEELFVVVITYIVPGGRFTSTIISGDTLRETLMASIEEGDYGLRDNEADGVIGHLVAGYDAVAFHAFWCCGTVVSVKPEARGITLTHDPHTPGFAKPTEPEPIAKE